MSVTAMPLLLSYGMLQEEHVQLNRFGRTLRGRKDQLCGFEHSTVHVADNNFARSSGSAEHPILRPTGRIGDKVHGFVFEVTDDELKRADRFEPAEYKRITVTLASGATAWVYIDAEFASQDHDSSDA